MHEFFEYYETIGTVKYFVEDWNLLNIKVLNKHYKHIDAIKNLKRIVIEVKDADD